MGDLEVDESYEQTWAKSYDAESYDEWDNLDRDKWGAQAWGKDRDLYGASSYNGAASGADHTHKAYGGVAGYGGWGKGGAVAYGGKASAHDVQASAGQKASAGAYDADAWPSRLTALTTTPGGASPMTSSTPTSTTMSSTPARCALTTTSGPRTGMSTRRRTPMLTVKLHLHTVLNQRSPRLLTHLTSATAVMATVATVATAATDGEHLI